MRSSNKKTSKRKVKNVSSQIEEAKERLSILESLKDAHPNAYLNIKNECYSKQLQIKDCTHFELTLKYNKYYYVSPYILYNNIKISASEKGFQVANKNYRFYLVNDLFHVLNALNLDLRNQLLNFLGAEYVNFGKELDTDLYNDPVEIIENREYYIEQIKKVDILK